MTTQQINTCQSQKSQEPAAQVPQANGPEAASQAPFNPDSNHSSIKPQSIESRTRYHCKICRTRSTYTDPSKHVRNINKSHKATSHRHLDEWQRAFKQEYFQECTGNGICPVCMNMQLQGPSAANSKCPSPRSSSPVDNSQIMGQLERPEVSSFAVPVPPQVSKRAKKSESHSQGPQQASMQQPEPLNSPIVSSPLWSGHPWSSSPGMVERTIGMGNLGYVNQVRAEMLHNPQLMTPQMVMASMEAWKVETKYQEINNEHDRVKQKLNNARVEVPAKSRLTNHVSIMVNNATDRFQNCSKMKEQLQSILLGDTDDQNKLVSATSQLEEQDEIFQNQDQEIRERQYQTRVYNDAESATEHLQKIGGDLTNRTDSHISALTAFMSDVDYEVNNNQTAITLAIAQQMMKRQRAQPGQIWSVPAGHGKSRIIVALVVHLLREYQCRSFVIVYNQQELLDYDRPKLNRIQEIFKHQTKIELLVAQLDGSIKITDHDQITIIDEVDNVLFDKRCCLVKHYLPTATRMPKVLGLTATAKTALLRTETQALEFYSLKVYDAMIPTPHRETAKIQAMQMNQFLEDQEHDSNVRLLYVPNSEKDAIMRICERRSLSPLLNCRDLSILKNLQKKTVLIVTDMELLRGYDYRSDSGIVLFMGNAVDSSRTLHQALCRVGRYGEYCKRFCRPDLLHEKKLVDSNLRDALLMNISRSQDRSKREEAEILKKIKADAKAATRQPDGERLSKKAAPSNNKQI